MYKKILIIFIFILINFPLYSQGENDSFANKNVILRNLRINFQANVLQSLSLSDSSEQHDHLLGNSFSAGLEISSEYKNIMNYGIGIFYQFPNSLEFTKGEIGVVPIYALMDFPLFENKEYPVLLSIRFGYAFVTTSQDIEKPDGGLYHAFGITMKLSQHVQTKLMYANSYGKIKIDRNEYQMRRGGMSLSIYFNM